MRFEQIFVYSEHEGYKSTYFVLILALCIYLSLLKMNQELEAIKFKQKERESLLKTIKDPLVDPETGEMIYPAPKYSTTTFKISLKK